MAMTTLTPALQAAREALDHFLRYELRKEDMKRGREALAIIDTTLATERETVDWTKPIEAICMDIGGVGELPRPAKVIGATKGAIDYIEVEILDTPGFHQRYHHPPGIYAASRNTGFIRGTLAIRNVHPTSPLIPLSKFEEPEEGDF